MFIVDSQVHLWKEETPDRPWVPGGRERIRLNGHREEAFTYPECLEAMDAAGVDRVLIVPPSWEGDRIDYALEAAQAYPDRFGIMARIPQNDPAEGSRQLRQYSGNPHVKGVRLTFHRPIDRDWMVDGTADWIWPLAEELGIPLMVHAPFWKSEIGSIANAHPGLKLIVDHMGIVARTVDDEIGSWVRETAELHKYPNVYVKVSALPGYSTQPFPYENISKYIHEMIDKMGARRCFWGTDLTRLIPSGINYRMAIEHVTDNLNLPQDNVNQIMGLAICECLGWEAPEN